MRLIIRQLNTPGSVELSTTTPTTPGYKELINFIGGMAKSDGHASNAAKSGYLELIKWFWVNGKGREFDWDPRGKWTMYYAAMYGHLHVIQWLISEGVDWGYITVSNAASGDHLHVLKWFKEHGGKEHHTNIWYSSIAANAAKNGHFKTLKWLLDNGVPQGNDVIECAAESGNLEMVQWLRRGDDTREPCPWNEYTIAYAAKRGHIKIVEWLRSDEYTEPCPWDWWSVVYAEKNDHTKMVDWLKDPKTGGGSVPAYGFSN